jgi:hypothetical protein
MEILTIRLEEDYKLPPQNGISQLLLTTESIKNIVKI